MNQSSNLTTNSNTYDTLFALLRSTLWGEERFPFVLDMENPPNWDEICKELSFQTVLVLPTDLLCRLDVANRKKYMLNARFHIARWYTVMDAQKALCEQLDKAGIPFVILKGAASACYYPQPVYRQMGDIDFLVPPEHFERARLLMLEEGYVLLDKETFRHIEFTKNNIVFELHRGFASFKDSERAKPFDNLLFDSFERLETFTMEGYSFPVFPSMENGLILLAHINEHLEDGLGLRQILDWALYVDKFLDDDIWGSSFAPIIHRLGLETLAITVTRMCQLYLGLRLDITWCASAEEALCHRLMGYLMEQGNFGRKANTEDSYKSVKVMKAAKNIPAFFKRLQYFGLKGWPAITKHPQLKPLLTPFAWFWQLCRYIHLGLKREQPFKSLIEDIQKSHDKDNFMEILGVKQK